jgi:hypothetical protein
MSKSRWSLANSLADYLIAAAGGGLSPERYRLPLALASLLIFYFVHVIGIRWMGSRFFDRRNDQVVMRRTVVRLPVRAA